MKEVVLLKKILIKIKDREGVYAVSELKVSVKKIVDVKHHPNADRLDCAKVDGWEVIVPRNNFANDDLVVFIPPDAILNQNLHEFLGVTKYCADLPKIDRERPTSKRVKATRLRGERSYGVIVSLATLYDYLNKHRSEIFSQITDECGPWGYPTLNQFIKSIKEEQDFTEHLDITKFEPIEKCQDGDREKQNPFFHKYTSIEKWQNYTNILEEDEQVVVLSKIHGQNIRVGYLDTPQYSGWVAGSHRIQRKEKDAHDRDSKFWLPLKDNNLKKLITAIKEGPDNDNIIVFAELYGDGIQDMTYDCQPGEIKYRVFDISVNREYKNWQYVQNMCCLFDVPLVPIIYLGPYSSSLINAYTDGPCLVCHPDKIRSKFKGREGIVIKPTTERKSKDLPEDGRVILKSVSVDYLNRKGGTDNA